MASSPDDKVHARPLRYCEGHLHRINGEARQGPRQAARRSTSSPMRSRRFARRPALRPNWPDPFLGLARTFIYGIEDIDRGADAMNQAQRLGYRAWRSGNGAAGRRLSRARRHARRRAATTGGHGAGTRLPDSSARRRTGRRSTLYERIAGVRRRAGEDPADAQREPRDLSSAG